MERELEKKETRKRDEPSPGSYDIIKSFDKT
jgi:hypothetical protein